MAAPANEPTEYEVAVSVPFVIAHPMNMYRNYEEGKERVIPARDAMLQIISHPKNRQVDPATWAVHGAGNFEFWPNNYQDKYKVHRAMETRLLAMVPHQGFSFQYLGKPICPKTVCHVSLSILDPTLR